MIAAIEPEVLFAPIADETWRFDRRKSATKLRDEISVTGPDGLTIEWDGCDREGLVATYYFKFALPESDGTTTTGKFFAAITGISNSREQERVGKLVLVDLRPYANDRTTLLLIATAVRKFFSGTSGGLWNIEAFDIVR